MAKDNKIDVIIPAYKAQGTILRTLASIAAQTIVEDAEVTIVNDDPEGAGYSKFIKAFKPFMKVREIKMEKNGGPGLARQKGIDETSHEYFTCIDADDTFAGAIALETLRAAITEPAGFQGRTIEGGFKCVSSTFIQLGEDLKHMVPHQGGDMVWMFGKLYRREFIEKYKVRFNETRANEDTGFNTIVRLLCDNPAEQLRAIPEMTYYWHNKADSITRINEGQYGFDQCFCGWTDNMIYAIKEAEKSRPFSGAVTQWIVQVMMELYFYFCECKAKKPVFAAQDWEYVKKYYYECYKEIEPKISDQVFAEMFSVESTQKWGSGRMLGVLPHIGIKEFMDKLKAEEYDPQEIYRVWERMEKDPETRDLIHNNEQCGVCAKGYTNRPF